MESLHSLLTANPLTRFFNGLGIPFVTKKIYSMDWLMQKYFQN